MHGELRICVNALCEHSVDGIPTAVHTLVDHTLEKIFDLPLTFGQSEDRDEGLVKLLFDGFFTICSFDNKLLTSVLFLLLKAC